MVYRAKRRGNLMRLLHGAYPEQNNEILPLRLTQGQNDKKRRVRNDNLSKRNLLMAFTIELSGQEEEPNLLSPKFSFFNTSILLKSTKKLPPALFLPPSGKVCGKGAIPISFKPKKDGLVKSRPMAFCHSERSEESNNINAF